MDFVPSLLPASGLWFAAAVFLVAGTVKGVVGLGLPTIAMALLVLMMSPAEAAALLIVPSLVTNVWQIRPWGGLDSFCDGSGRCREASRRNPRGRLVAGCSGRRLGDDLARCRADCLCSLEPDGRATDRAPT